MLILFPTRMEAEYFLGPLSDTVPTSCNSIPLELKGVSCEAALCSVGLINAAATASYTLASYGVREKLAKRVFLLGIAGSFHPERAPVGTAYRVSKVFCHGVGIPGDNSCSSVISPFLPPAQEQESAHLVSVPRPSESPDEAKALASLYPTALAEEMEGYGVALACSLHNIPCTIIRGISNEAGVRDKSRWRIPQAMDAVRSVWLNLVPGIVGASS